MIRSVFFLAAVLLLATGCGSGDAHARQAAADGVAGGSGCEVVYEDQEIQDADGRRRTVRIPVCKGWDRDAAGPAPAEGECRRVEWRLKLAANHSGGAPSMIRTPVCIR